MARLPRQGFTVASAEGKKPPPPPAHSRLLCQFTASDGTRCRYPGSMSTDTTGQGDWFCNQHFRLPASAEEMQRADAIVHESLHKAPRLETAEDIRGLAMACMRRRAEEQELVRMERVKARRATTDAADAPAP